MLLLVVMMPLIPSVSLILLVSSTSIWFPWPSSYCSMLSACLSLFVFFVWFSLSAVYFAFCLNAHPRHASLAGVGFRFHCLSHGPHSRCVQDGGRHLGVEESGPVFLWVASARELFSVARKGGPCALSAMLKCRLHRLLQSDYLPQICEFPVWRQEFDFQPPELGPFVVSGLISVEA